MTQRVAVVDYGMGNLRSVSQAVLHAAQGLDVDRAQVRLPQGPLKTTGEYEIAVALYTDAAKALGLTAPIWQTTETGSDHNAFRRAGFPAVGLTEEYRHNDTSPFIHRAGDTFETVNFAYLGTVTRIVAQAIRQLLTVR